jgi:F-box interacting protein
MQLHAIHVNIVSKKSPKIMLIDPLSGLFSTLPRQWRELHPRNIEGFLFCPRLGSRMVCSKPCHGLVVGSYTTQQYSFDFVCNPTMGYYKEMRLDPGGDANFLAGRIRLGYDSRTNKHVRVRLVYHERNMDTRNYQLECYVHLTDTEAAWRPIASPPRPVAEMQPVHVEGKLYWMVDPNLAGTKSSPTPGSGCEILALDVGTEEFEVLQGPRCSSYDEITSIVELDGNVCVVCSDRGANALVIWTLDAGNVWAIKRRVELREFSHEYSSQETAPMAVDPTDGRLLLSTGRALGYYSPTTRTVETIHRLVDQDAMKFAPLLSEESLICPYIRFQKATYSVGM